VETQFSDRSLLFEGNGRVCSRFFLQIKLKVQLPYNEVSTHKKVSVVIKREKNPRALAMLNTNCQNHFKQIWSVQKTISLASFFTKTLQILSLFYFIGEPFQDCYARDS
jgi:hypothetical protein